MIIEVTGDILLSQAQVIAHGVAPNDDFGQGLALSLREQWPSLYKDFRHFCQTQHPKEGTMWSWMSSEGKIIVNLLTQEGAYNHGQKAGKASTPHVNHALRELHKFLLSENVSRSLFGQEDPIDKIIRLDMLKAVCAFDDLNNSAAL